MPIKPSLYPEWTDGSAPLVIEPPAGQKATGWTLGEAPPFRFMNWIHWVTYRWIVWFDFVTDGTNLQSTITANTTGASPVRTYLADPTAGSFTFTFPAAATEGPGVRFTIKNIGFGSANVVHFLRSGSDTLENGTTLADLAAGEYYTFESNGVSKWLQVG